MTKTQGILGVFIIGMFLVMLGIHFYVPKHSSVGRHTHSYLLDMEFEQVKKILMRTDSLSEIVSSQHGRVVQRKWHNLNLSTDRILKGFDVHGEGEFYVVTENPQVGQLQLRFMQRVAITKTGLNSETFLGGPVGHIKDIVTKTQMAPEGTRTRVNNEVYLRYERRVPKNWVQYMDEQVQAATVQMTQKSEQAITALVEKYRGKRIIIPLKRSKE